MGRDLQLVHLAEAERHVTIGQRIIARQEAIVMAFEAHGDDTRLAKAVLATFVQSLQLHEEHLLRIRNELRWTNDRQPRDTFA